MAQVIIHFRENKKRKHRVTFAKAMFMFLNVFYISRLIITDQLSFT